MSRFFPIAVLALAALLAPANAGAQDVRERLDKIFGGVGPGEVGASVVDLATGATLYERSADKPLSLASNTKLITTAAALDRLGPDFRFETSLLRRGTIAGDLLTGDLVIRGGGDPCLGGRFDGEADGALRRLARSLKEAGVRKVTGDLIADDRLFDREHQHPGWPADQLDRWYAAPVSSLALNDGCVDVTVSPGARPGAPAIVSLEPRCGLFVVENRCVTTGNRKEHVVDIGRAPGANRIIVRGAFLAGAQPATTSIAVHDPALVFATVMRERIEAEGIAIAGATRLVGADEKLEGTVRLAVHASLLAQALPVVNKRSQNHYAEMMLKALGAAKGEGGSWRSGVAVEAKVLEAIGIDPEEYALADGSGLARANRLSARGMTRLLAHMAKHEHASTFVASLAVAGVDGTLKDRLRAPSLRGRVVAKTGTINAVSALSGYVLDEAGQPRLAFSFLMNGLRQGPGKAREAQDGAVEALVP